LWRLLQPSLSTLIPPLLGALWVALRRETGFAAAGLFAAFPDWSLGLDEANDQPRRLLTSFCSVSWHAMEHVAHSCAGITALDSDGRSLVRPSRLEIIEKGNAIRRRGGERWTGKGRFGICQWRALHSYPVKSTACARLSEAKAGIDRKSDDRGRLNDFVSLFSPVAPGPTARHAFRRPLIFCAQSGMLSAGVRIGLCWPRSRAVVAPKRN